MKKLTNNINIVDATIGLFNMRKKTSYSKDDFLILYGDDINKWSMDFDEIKNYINTEKSETLTESEILYLTKSYGDIVIPDNEKEDYENYLKSHIKVMSDENKIFKKFIKRYGRDNYKFYTLLDYNTRNINCIHKLLGNKQNVNDKKISSIITEKWLFDKNRLSTNRKYYICIDTKFCYFHIVDEMLDKDNFYSNQSSLNWTYHNKVQHITDNYIGSEDLETALIHFKELGDFHYNELSKLNAFDNTYDTEHVTIQNHLMTLNKRRKLIRERIPSIIKNYKRLFILNKIIDDR